nr:MAG TPA: hypothetical protein [Caudoviricetes sp.]
MKLTTISEKEILKAAWEDRLRRWLNRIDENERFVRERGRDSKIATHWIKIYKAQVDELELAIKALEDAE